MEMMDRDVREYEGLREALRMQNTIEEERAEREAALQ